MKLFKNFSLTALLSLSLFGAVTFTSCNQDECKDVVCQNGGTCNEDNGSCTCPTGYEGANCETTSRGKFIKVWTATDVATGGDPFTYTCPITLSGTNVTSVTIDNSFAESFFNTDITGTVNGNTLTVPSQEPDGDDFKVSGSATFANNALTWTYTITDPDNETLNVTGTWQ